ncbi:MAG: Ig domain-containing protein [Bacteroidales bacterium]|nr:Ig domain-containing protein [Bacteroidales bacterium]
MKNLVKTLCIVGLFALAVVGCKKHPQEVQVTIHLNKELITSLPVGSEQTLVATVKPEDAAVSVIWSSDNEKVAVVNDEGVVTGVAPGTAVITAKADDAVATCKVTVTAVKPTKIELSSRTLELTVGSEHALEVKITPENAVADDITWYTTDDKVATVKDGLVKAVAKGDATITVKCNGGELAAVCQVKVTEENTVIKPTAVEVAPETLALKVGEKGTLTVTYTPSNAEVTDLVWETSDNTVATVADGEVTALKAGEALITAKCNNGELSSSCKVTVTAETEPDPTPDPEPDKLIAVTIVPQDGKTDVQVGEHLNLTAVYTPSDAKPNSVSWTVDNEILATIDQNGVLEGVLATKGSDNNWMEVVVTVTADGLSTNLRVRVIPKQAEDIQFSVPENNQIKIGSGWRFEPKVYPEDLGFGVLAISDPFGNISDGFYTNPSAPGRYSYTFTLADHENLVNEYKLSRSVSLDVIPYWVETVSLPESLSMEAGSSLTLTPAFTSDVEGYQPTYKDVVWSSSDKTVATVNERTGEISALKAGTVEITVTTCHSWSVPSGESHKSATCVVTIDEPAVALNIGDYYYSDGTWSSELDPSKKVIGIVFSKANAAASDSHLASDYPGCTHGLVLSTEELLTSCAEGRSWSWLDLGNWCYGNGYGQFYDLDKPVGYSNTLGFEAANAAAIQSYGYTIDFTMFNSTSQLMSHRDAVAVPSTASRWYIPSYKEMVMLYENVGLVNERLEAVGGDVLSVTRAFYDDISYQYWCSTFDLSNKVIRAFSMLSGDWHGSKTEGTKLGCRVVLAF